MPAGGAQPPCERGLDWADIPLSRGGAHTNLSRGLGSGAVAAVIRAAVIRAAGYGFRPVALTLPAMLVVGAFLSVIPPFSYAIWSALGMSDPSAVGHSEAISEGYQILFSNLLGVGVGNGDHAAIALGEGEAIGVGENTYLSVLIEIGPLGLLTRRLGGRDRRIAADGVSNTRQLAGVGHLLLPARVRLFRR